MMWLVVKESEDICIVDILVRHGYDPIGVPVTIFGYELIIFRMKQSMDRLQHKEDNSNG